MLRAAGRAPRGARARAAPPTRPTGSCSSATLLQQLRHGPVADRARRRARRRSARSARRSATARRSCWSPGNHDHALVAPWLERRATGGEPSLGLEQRDRPDGLRAGGHARRLARRRPHDARLPGPLAARRRLRDARPLPRPPRHRADVRAPGRGRDGPRGGADADRRRLARGLRGGARAAVRVAARGLALHEARLRAPEGHAERLAAAHRLRPAAAARPRARRRLPDGHPGAEP